MSFADLKKISEHSVALPVQQRNTRNVPLAIQSYDLQQQTVTGIDLATGDEMTIALRPDPKANERARPRSGVADFAGAGVEKEAHPDRTQIDGVVVFLYVVPDPKRRGVHTAMYGRPLSRSPEESDVFVAHAAPFISSTGKFAMDVVRTLAAAPVTDVDELRSHISDALHSQFAGAVIRATDGVDTVVYGRGGSDRVERIKEIDGKLEKISADEAVEDFLRTPFGSALVSSLNAAQDFVVEVIPVERIYASKSVTAAIKTQEAFERGHQMGTGVGYTETIVTVRHHEDYGTYLTAKPLTIDTLPELYRLQDIPTSNISPRVAPYVAAARNRNAGFVLDGISDELQAVIDSPGIDDEAKRPTAVSGLRPR